MLVVAGGHVDVVWFLCVLVVFYVAGTPRNRSSAVAFAAASVAVARVVFVYVVVEKNVVNTIAVVPPVRRLDDEVVRRGASDQALGEGPQGHLQTCRCSHHQPPITPNATVSVLHLKYHGLQFKRELSRDSNPEPHVSKRAC